MRSPRAWRVFGLSDVLGGTSAPNPKFAHVVPRVRPRTSGSKRGTRIIELLVVLDSEVRKRGSRTNDANFGIGPLGLPRREEIMWPMPFIVGSPRSGTALLR